MLGDHLQALVTVPPTVVTRGTGYGRSHQVVAQALVQAGLGPIPAAGPDTVLHALVQGTNQAMIGSSLRESPDVPFAGYGSRFGSSWSGLRFAPVGSVPRSGRSILVVGRASDRGGGLRVDFSNGTTVVLRADRVAGTLTVTVNGTVTVLDLVEQEAPVLAVQTVGTAQIRVWKGPSSPVLLPAPVTAGATISMVEFREALGVEARYTTDSYPVVASLSEVPPAWSPSRLEQVRIQATRGVENVTARSVVDAWSEATLASVWMDEHGAPILRGRDIFVTRAPDRVLRVDERVFDGAWSVGDDQVRSRVLVRSQAPTRTSTGVGKTILWQPDRAEEIEPNVWHEQIVSVPDDQDWHGLDRSMDPIIQAKKGIDNQVRFSKRDGSFWQICFSPEDAQGELYRWTGGAETHQTVDATLEVLGQRAIKLSHRVLSNDAVFRYYLASPTMGVPDIPIQWRGVPMPIIRGDMLVTWVETIIEGATTGPDWAPILELDAAWWLDPEDAQRVADALATEVSTPAATLERVEVLWDPTRQIGDVETWIAVDADGGEAWTANVLITGYSESWDGDVPSQQVDARVISLTDPAAGKTYLDLADTYEAYRDIAGTYAGVYEALPERT